MSSFKNKKIFVTVSVQDAEGEETVLSQMELSKYVTTKLSNLDFDRLDYLGYEIMGLQAKLTEEMLDLFTFAEKAGRD